MKRTGRLVFPAFVVAALLVYGKALTGPFIFDDMHTIVQNEGIRHITDIFNVFFSDSPTRPFLFLTFALNYLAGGLNPLGYHLVNLFIHAGAAWVVYRIIRHIFRQEGVESELYPVLGGALFLLHPMQVDAVAYVASRSSSLCAFLYFAAFYLFITKKPDSRWMMAAFFLYALALFTKSLAVTFPALLTIYLFQFHGREGVKAYRWPLAFTWVMLPVYLAFRALISGHPIENVDPERELNSIIYFKTQLYVVAFEYIPRLLFPIGQVFDAQNKWRHSWAAPEVLGGLAVFLLLMFVAARYFRRSRAVSFGVIWFIVALSVSSSIIPIIDMYVERRLYIAMPGVALLASWGLWKAADLYSDRKRHILGLVGVVLLVFSGLTFHRSSLYASPQALWQDTVDKAWAKARIYPHLAFQYMDMGRFEKAEEVLMYGKVAFPHYPKINLMYGWLLANQGQYAQAEREIAGIKPETTREMSLYFIIKGVAAAEKGQVEEARTLLGKAVEIDPANHVARVNLAIFHSRTGNRAEALATLRKGAQEWPAEPMYPYELAKMMLPKNPVMARAMFKKALQVSPDYAPALKALERLNNQTKEAE